MPIKMHPNTRPTLISVGLKAIGVAVASTVLLTANADAAGLGKLTVLSALGQPLRAEIELNAVPPEEVGALIAKLAPTDAYRLANIEFNPALLSLRFAVEQRSNGRQVVRISSVQPINEPFVDMLLELDWNSGRLVREYTFLLDPSDLRSSQSAQVAPVDVPGLAGKPQTQSVQVAPQMEAADKNGRERATRAKAGTPAGEYTVRRGDSLSKIAARLKPEGVSLDQMLVALYRANSNAFIGNNINRLRAGEILAVPDSDTARGIGSSEAKGVVIAQAADFNSYRNKLAGQVGRSAPTKSSEAKQSASGKITAKVEENKTAANTREDRLKLSKTIVSSAAQGNGKVSGSKTSEEQIAKDKRIEAANARVKELEQNVSDLQKLMEIRNKAMASASAQKPAEVKAASAASSPVAPVAPVATTTPAPVASAPVASKVASAASASASAPAPASASVPSASASASVVAPASTPVAAAPVKPKHTPAPPPPPEPGILDMLGDNLLLILGVLLGFVGIVGGYFGFNAWRKKKKQPADASSSILDNSSMQANSLFGSTGGQSVDTSNSVFNSNFAPSASQLDTNEVDPVAEADVYIAYGRDVQAEEILKEALRTQPERNAVRLKLLEIYASRKDTRSFEVQAGELYGLTHGDGEDWAQAASLGMSIDPNNPLYAGGDMIGDSAKPAPILHAATEPLDELDPEALMTNSQQPVDPFDFDATPASTAGKLNANQLTDLDLDLSQPQAAMTDDDFDFGLGKIEAAPVVEELRAAAVPEEDDHVLDFDLGGLSFEPVEPKKTVPAGKPAEKPAAKPVEMSFESPAKIALDKPNDLELDIGSIDFGLPQIDQGMSSPGAKESFDIPSIDDMSGAPRFDTPTSPTLPTSLQDFDLSSIDLELNQGGLDLSDDGVEGGSAQMEMDTKLDLAVAYQEIGDKEGARELIDEVIKGGTPEQIEKAKAMRAKLA